jgi:hypothetical protein
MQVVSGARLKLGHKVEVEVPRLSGLGVNKQAAATDVIGDLDEAGKDILEEAGSKPVAFVVDVDAQPGQKSDRLKVATGSFA